ncbi:MAG TPA: WGR domain-containing protein [Myxococcota bacterium]
MRRFEFVEGSSSKFWSPGVEGSTFTVVYGRIGTAGQRKEKEFDDEAAAQKEYDKKVAEKLREGYVEVAGDGGEAPAPKAKKEPARPTIQPLPVRVKDAVIDDAALIKAAARALTSFVKSTSNRSWRRRQAAKEAKRALSRIAGVDVAAHPALAGALDTAADAVLAAQGLPLSLVLQLVSSLPTAAVARVFARWSTTTGAAAAAVNVLNGLKTALNDDVELAWRAGRVLVDRDIADRAALASFATLRPFIDARVEGGSSALLAGIDAGGDDVVARRVQALRA